MQIVAHPLTKASHQIAMDEALLLIAEEQTSNAGGTCEFIRVWEFEHPTVIVGRSSRVAEEVDIDFCRSEGIPIFRRCTGGASVVGGPGCLMYSVVLDLDLRPDLARIDVTHQFVMQHLQTAVNRQLRTATEAAQFQGTCDLTFNNCKFSGNSMRMARHHLLYHGTLLYDGDLALIARCLKFAPRQPDYRAERDHEHFITNINVDPAKLKRDVVEVFGARETWREALPQSQIQMLCEQRYENTGWNFSR